MTFLTRRAAPPGYTQRMTHTSFRPAAPRPACAARRPAPVLSPLERALLRLLVAGRELRDAAPSVGVSPAEADAALEALQARAGVRSRSRLLALAILHFWV